MHVSAWAIRNPIPVTLLFVLLLLAGIAGYSRLPIKLLPDISSPNVQVSVRLLGAAPGEVENQVTREIEASVSNLAGVQHVQSTVSLGRSQTTIRFEIGHDPQKAGDDVRAAVERVRISLPREIEEPVITRLDSDPTATVTYGVTSAKRSEIDLSWFVDDVVQRRMSTLAGVGKITRVGGFEREINVTLEPDRIAALGLTAPEVNLAVRRTAANMPGGRTEIGKREQTVRIVGAAETIEKLEDIAISTGDGRWTRLGDVATVSSGPAERTRFAQLNNEPVVAFQVMKTMAASDVAVEDQVDAAVEQLQREHPEVRFTKLISGSQRTHESYESTVSALIEGMLLAALVVFLFLRDWRSTIIAAIAMPASLIPTFAVMSLCGFSLNLVSLLALTLVVGVLVDDAIVEIENIGKRIEAGEPPFQAALIGTDAIGLAVMATTMAIVVVFAPVSFMPGSVGRYFREFGATVACSVLFSLLVARLLTPLVAAYFLKPRKAKPRKTFTGRYRRAVEWALSHRQLSIGGALALFIGSLLLGATLPTGVVPVSNNGVVVINVEAAPGARLDDTRRATRSLTNALHRDPDVSLVFASIGAEGDVRSGNVTVLLKPERRLTTQQFQAAFRPILFRIPDVRLSYGTSGIGEGSSVQVILSGEDGEALERAALDLELQMRRLPELANVHQLTPRASEELVVRPKPGEAARLGVSAETLAAVVRVATLGEVDANVAKFNEGVRRLPIRVRLSDVARTDLDTILSLKVPVTGGGTVPLAAVADLAFEPGSTRIERFDQERRITVAAELNGVTIGQALEAIDRLPVLHALPAGVTRPAFGQAVDMTELFAGFIIAMGAGIAMIYAVLVLLFGSFFKPIIILAALPLSLAGAFVALAVGQSALNLPALIGLLMLMGLAAKNSILLVEHTIKAERAGASQHDALIDACQERARPIVMTSFAMAAGMAPALLGIGPGSEFRVPMALAVIGGLISSTTLSLILIPTVYEVVEDLENWVRRPLARLITPASDGQPGAASGV